MQHKGIYVGITHDDARDLWDNGFVFYEVRPDGVVSFKRSHDSTTPFSALHLEGKRLFVRESAPAPALLDLAALTD